MAETEKPTREKIEDLKKELNALKENMLTESQNISDDYYSNTMSTVKKLKLQAIANDIKSKERELAKLILQWSREAAGAARAEPATSTPPTRSRAADEPARTACEEEPCSEREAPPPSLPLQDSRCIAIWEKMQPPKGAGGGGTVNDVTCGQPTLKPTDAALKEIGKLLNGKAGVNKAIAKWEGRGWASGEESDAVFGVVGNDGSAKWTKGVLMMAACEVIEQYWKLGHKNAEVWVHSHFRTSSSNHRTYSAIDYFVKIQSGGKEEYQNRLPALTQWVGQRLLITNGKLPNGASGLYLNVSYEGSAVLEKTSCPEGSYLVQTHTNEWTCCPDGFIWDPTASGGEGSCRVVDASLFPITDYPPPSFGDDNEYYPSDAQAADIAEAKKEASGEGKVYPFPTKEATKTGAKFPWGPKPLAGIGGPDFPTSHGGASHAASGPGGSAGVHYDMRGHTYKGAPVSYLNIDIDGDSADEIQKTRDALAYMEGRAVTIADDRTDKKNVIGINAGKQFTLPADTKRGNRLGPVAKWFRAYRSSEKKNPGPQAQVYLPRVKGNWHKVANLNHILNMWANDV